MNSNPYHTAPIRSLTSRFYETEHDLQQMQGLLMEARSRSGDWHYLAILARSGRVWLTAGKD